MTSMFSPKVPKPQAVQALPQVDDQASSEAKAKVFAKQDQTSGAGGNQLTESKLGDYSQAATRTGALPASSIVTG